MPPKTPAGARKFAAQASNRREAYIQALIDLRALADSTAKAYEELAEDAEVKDAAGGVEQAVPAEGDARPLADHLANVKLLEKAEAGILTETIQLRSDNGVFWVDVTLNGKVTIPMIFDTGAGILSLGKADAAKVGLVPSPSDRTITLQVADGSSHEAKMMTLDSVRVGKFTVRNVECAVSSKEKSNVPPLLGGPFLKHFTFKMNQAAGTVTFTKIETPETATPKQGRRQGEDRRTFATRPDDPAEGRARCRECRHAVSGQGRAPLTRPPGTLSRRERVRGEGLAGQERRRSAVRIRSATGRPCGQAASAASEVGRRPGRGHRRQGLVEGAGLLPLAVDLVVAQVAEHGRHGDALGGRLAEVAAAVAVQVGRLLPVLLQQPRLLGRERVAAGRDVLAEVAPVGHLADDDVHPPVHPDRLDRGDFLLEALLHQAAAIFSREVGRPPLRLHGDQAEVGLGQPCRRRVGACRGPRRGSCT